MATKILVDNDSGSGLLPHGTKPWPGLILTERLSQGNLTEDGKICWQKYHLKLNFLKMFMHLSGNNELRHEQTRSFMTDNIQVDERFVDRKS